MIVLERTNDKYLKMGPRGSIIFLPPGGSWNLGEHMNFGNRKGEQKNFWYLKGGGGGQKNFTDPTEKIKKSNY